MRYRSLGRTGVQVSELCLGCGQFGEKSGEAVSTDIIDRAIDRGINFIDTANVYGHGRSEEIIGKALKRNAKRDRMVLATKVHGQMYWLTKDGQVVLDDGDPNASGSNRRHIIESCEASLRRLQTDYIDMYQIHRPSSDVPIDETLRALDDLIRAGKVRYIGTSTFAAWQIMEALWVAKELGLNRFVCEQPPYHLLDRRAERELIPMAQTYGIAVICWSPLAGGFLTGKYCNGELPPIGARLNPSADQGYGEAAYRVLGVVESLAKEKECAASNVSLAWCTGQSGVTCAIIGPKTVEQLEDNLGAVEIEVTAEDRKRLDEVSDPKHPIVPYYEADIAPHRYRW